MRNLLLTTGLLSVLSLGASAVQAQDLTIYTYDSFTSDWGPGPKVKENFEKSCGCTVNFVAVADGVALLNRLKLEGKSTKADIVLGLDTNLINDAKASGLFAPHGLSDVKSNVPDNFQDDVFLPYDYSYFAVIYDSEKMKNPPKSMAELIDGDASQKIILMDPRTSTPGLGMMLWVKDLYGDKAAEQWQKLSKRVLTVTPGWSEGYGLFTKGEAPMVLSYTTSAAYHMISDKTERYKAVTFEEGNYLQIELAGQTINGAKNPRAAEFLKFMTTAGFQDVIPQTNWMYPAYDTSAPLDAAFDALPKPDKSLLIASETVAQNRKAWVDEWLKAMSR
ncbi:thiamine ABC transporter substrate binding subunit [Pseudochrobactrum algeriensis]|nr:thiamine ABC transporter substrate binding subunit [Pseudochrobactrum algeriensis]QVQ38539.1 thiamine ABC transporter substrate binding subunit [Pseudochrobactrum algeriensis]QVQ41754.1 thiamine ABC transporter substrate binding subunit [Pseudochrobactrum algeriensis]QVQ45683.1 thiamine ABC transporter substrate binding subunit [Pseudochrobactrum algeriensis]